MVFVAMVHKRVMRLTPWGEIWCCGITNTMLNASMHYLCAKCAKIDCVIKLIVIFITCVTDFQLRSLATVKHASWGACPLPIPFMNNDYLHSDSDLDTQNWTLKKISFSAPLSILATLCLSLAHSSTKPPSIHLYYLSSYGSMSYLMGMTNILQWSWASLSSVAFLQCLGQMQDSGQHNMFLWLNKWPYSFTVCLSLPRYAAPLDSLHMLRNVSATWMGLTFPRNATLHIELEQSINPKCSCSSQFWSQIQCQIHLCPLWMGRRCCRQPLSMSLQGKTTPISPRVTTTLQWNLTLLFISSIAEHPLSLIISWYIGLRTTEAIQLLTCPTMMFSHLIGEQSAHAVARLKSTHTQASNGPTTFLIITSLQYSRCMHNELVGHL